MTRRTGLALTTGAALVLVVAIGGSLTTGGSELQAFPEPAEPQSFPEPATNGLIAYSYEGDIYVGDPVTGETTAIVTNPTYEVNPAFSPDGTRIAFMRGAPHSDPSVLVVHADGSGERVVMPKGFSKGVPAHSRGRRTAPHS